MSCKSHVLTSLPGGVSPSGAPPTLESSVDSPVASPAPWSVLLDDSRSRRFAGFSAALSGPGGRVGVSAAASCTCMWYLYVDSVLSIFPETEIKLALNDLSTVCQDGKRRERIHVFIRSTLEIPHNTRESSRRTKCTPPLNPLHSCDPNARTQIYLTKG